MKLANTNLFVLLGQ